MQRFQPIVSASGFSEHAETFGTYFPDPVLFDVKMVQAKTGSSPRRNVRFDLLTKKSQSSRDFACRKKRQSQIFSPLKIAVWVCLDIPVDSEICVNNK